MPSADLYNQHTLETGQNFSFEAITEACYSAQGHPCFTNAIAHQVCLDVPDRSKPITKRDIYIAAEKLKRQSHPVLPHPLWDLVESDDL